METPNRRSLVTFIPPKEFHIFHRDVGFVLMGATSVVNGFDAEDRYMCCSKDPSFRWITQGHRFNILESPYFAATEWTSDLIDQKYAELMASLRSELKTYLLSGYKLSEFIGEVNRRTKKERSSK